MIRRLAVGGEELEETILQLRHLDLLVQIVHLEPFVTLSLGSGA